MAKTIEELEMAAGIGKLPKPKETTVDVSKLTIHKLNPRFNGTNNVLGINTRNGLVLRQNIKNDGRILKHLIILRSKVKNETTGKDETLDEVIAGGSRTVCGQSLMADETTPQGVIEELRKTPAFIYENLTPEQILFIANDQDQKDFSYAEIVQLIFTLFSIGHTWKQVATAVYRQWGKVKGDASRVNKADSFDNPEKLQQFLGTWLKGQMDYIFNSAHRVGPLMKDQMVIEAAERDRLIITKANARTGETVNHAGPYVKLLSKQDRCKALLAAKEEDFKNNNWNPLTGGPAFKKLWDEYHNEDLGLNPDGTPLDKKTEPSARSRKVILDAAKGAGSQAVQRALKMAAGDEATGWADYDAKATIFEATDDMFMQVREQIEKSNPAVYAALYNVFTEPKLEKRREYFLSLGVKFPEVKKPESFSPVANS